MRIVHTYGTHQLRKLDQQRRNTVQNITTRHVASDGPNDSDHGGPLKPNFVFDRTQTHRGADETDTDISATGVPGGATIGSGPLVSYFLPPPYSHNLIARRHLYVLDTTRILVHSSASG